MPRSDRRQGDEPGRPHCALEQRLESVGVAGLYVVDTGREGRIAIGNSRLECYGPVGSGGSCYRLVMAPGESNGDIRSSYCGARFVNNDNRRSRLFLAATTLGSRNNGIDVRSRRATGGPAPVDRGAAKPMMKFYAKLSTGAPLHKLSGSCSKILGVPCRRVSNRNRRGWSPASSRA